MQDKCNEKKIAQLKAISEKQNDPKIKQVIDKKIEQVVKPFNK